jgi:hypothetical protein
MSRMEGCVVARRAASNGRADVRKKIKINTLFRVWTKLGLFAKLFVPIGFAAWGDMPLHCREERP